MDKIIHINKSIENAEQNLSKLTPDSLAVDGQTGLKIRHFLNNVVNFENANYLEIGINRGATLISSLFGNKPNSSYAIEICETYVDEILSLKPRFNIQFNLLNKDCFDLDLSKINNKINVYLYDGDHSYESHYKALEYYYSILDDEFIFLLDDWVSPLDIYYPDWKQVLEATHDVIKHLNLKILFQTSKQRITPKKNNWWQGFWITLLKK
jgi:hypothetical protein